MVVTGIWDRLARVKARDDPANPFRLDHDVAPAIDLGLADEGVPG